MPPTTRSPEAIESFRAQARCVRDLRAELEDILNPSEFKTKAAEALSVDAKTTELRNKFVRYQKTYATVWPDGCPPDMRRVAEEEIGPIHVDLEMVLLIPKTLLESKVRVPIKPVLRYHGGGGVTGAPDYDAWRYQADLEYVLETPGAISIEPGYCLAPESDSDTILGNIPRILWWLFHELETTLRQINTNFFVRWDYFYIFGASFGGRMATETYLTIARQGCKPPELRVRALFLRYPVVETYERPPGRYMGTFISEERACRDSNRAFEVLEKMPWVIPRAMSNPPWFMYGAPIFSISRSTRRFWKAPSLIETVFRASACPDNRTEVLIEHGDEDEHVNWRVSENLAEALDEKWGLRVVFKLHPGKAHAWDYREPLSDEQKLFLYKAGARD